MMMVGGVGGTQTTETSSAQQNLKAKDGKILELEKSAKQNTETREMVIPINFDVNSSELHVSSTSIISTELDTSSWGMPWDLQNSLISFA